MTLLFSTRSFLVIPCSFPSLFQRCCFLFFPGACGGFLQTSETPMFLFSPGWPERYNNNIDCSWLLQAPDSTIELNILSLDIEFQRNCTYDKLVILDGKISDYVSIHTQLGLWMIQLVLVDYYFARSFMKVIKKGIKYQNGLLFLKNIWECIPFPVTELLIFCAKDSHFTLKRRHSPWLQHGLIFYITRPAAFLLKDLRDKSEYMIPMGY